MPERGPLPDQGSAVHNNAVWCDAVCRALGCDTAWVDGLWLDRSPGPPYYSNAVTLRVDGQDAQLARVREMLASPLPRPWTIKDGFHALDLGSLGFDVLFEAEWLALPHDAPLSDARVDIVRWSHVTDADELGHWEAAWRGANPDAAAAGVIRVFEPSLLDDPHIRFLAGRQDDAIVAVVIANRSDDGSGPVVGISNIVLGGDLPEAYRAGAVRAVQEAFPGTPLVGYERGDDLVAMRALGFDSFGPLRVWITRD